MPRRHPAPSRLHFAILAALGAPLSAAAQTTPAADPQVTTIPFNMRIIARDAANNVFPLNGAVSLRVRTFGSGQFDDDAIAARLQEVIDFRLGGIVRDLQLKKLPEVSKGGYGTLAVYGHMGRTDLDVPWERTDKVEALK